MARELTPKQHKFIAAYLGSCHGNGVKAARAAGYTGNDHTLRSIASENLTKPDIAAAIREALDEISRHGIGDKRNRINAYDRRWDRLHRVIEARGAAYADEAPGAEAGIMVRSYKQVGQGPTAQLMEEWSVDTGLLGELRALEQQAAKELGQWVDKGELTGKNGSAIEVRRFVGVDVDSV